MRTKIEYTAEDEKCDWWYVHLTVIAKTEHQAEEEFDELAAWIKDNNDYGIHAIGCPWSGEDYWGSKAEYGDAFAVEKWEIEFKGEFIKEFRSLVKKYKQTLKKK